MIALNSAPNHSDFHEIDGLGRCGSHVADLHSSISIIDIYRHSGTTSLLLDIA